MIDVTQIAHVGGLSGSVLTLFCLLGLIVAGFYMATSKTSTVMSQSRKAYYTFFGFLMVGIFLAGTSRGLAAYGPMRSTFGPGF